MPASTDRSHVDPPVALITGGGSGIGRSIALSFAARGCSVCVAGRTLSRLEETAAMIHSSTPEADTHCLVADLGDGAAAEGVVDEALSRAGRVDVLVHAAATCAPVPVLDLSAEVWDDMLNVALRGTVLCTLAVARHMVARGSGRIIMITSIDQAVVEPGLAHYCAAKAGLASFARSLAVELAPSGVCVNSVAPGWISTDTAAPRLGRASTESMQRLNALARPGEPAEIANVVTYLGLDAPRFLLGETLTVDGGQTIKAAMP